jgi:hypothetical protein
MKYQIQICRVSYAFNTVEIEASSQDEAEATVLDLCGDYNFSEKDAEYTIESIIELEETIR